MTRAILSEAINALGHYRLRSVLTMASVAWGVASLMLLLSYGNGFGLALTRAFESTGKDMIVIFPGQTSIQAGGERAGRRILLEMKDVDAIADNVQAIQAVSPEAVRSLSLSTGYRSREYSVSGVHASFQYIRNMAIESGRFIKEEDIASRRRMVVLGSTMKQELFSGLEAVGSEVRINGMRFTVIGVLKKKVQISNYGPPDDVRAFVPLTALSDLVDTRYLSNIVVLPASSKFRENIISEIRAAMARVHNFNPSDERAVLIFDWNTIKAILDNLSLGLEILLTLIGTLTLGIGAVGVMNIMLVSVTERTREIGMLKSIGARRRDILVQFMLEGLTITLLGGIIGYLVVTVMTGLIGVLPLLGPLYKDNTGSGDISLSISLSSLVVSSIILILVGLVAAFFPARRAAGLSPMEALRRE